MIEVAGRNLSSVEFSAGQSIFREGDTGQCGYIIEAGKVEITVDSHRGSNLVAVLSKGDIFGEMAIIGDTTRSATAKCVEDCVLFEVSKQQLKDRVENSDPIVRMLLKVLTARLRLEIQSTEKKIREVNRKLRGLGVPDTEIAKTNHAQDQSAIDKIKIESLLFNAVQNNELELHYQPIVRLSSQKTIGFEGLLRWNNPQLGTVRPDIFIGISEETDLIHSIGRWVLERGIRDFKALKQIVPGLKYVSLNVSGRQLDDEGFFDVLSHAIRKNKIDPDCINLELTETTLSERVQVPDWIRDCRKMGVQIGMDDFGTGYSSLGNLGQYEIDRLKLDRAFLNRMLSDKRSLTILRSVVKMSQELGLAVIAEGIEQADQAKILVEMGCTYGQGFYFDRPQSLETIQQRSRSKKKKAA